MYTWENVKNGIVAYLDRELLPQVTGWQKWVLGASLSISMEKSVNTFNAIKENPFIQAMGIIDKDDNIDVDLLHDHFLEQAKKGAVTFKAPLIGDVTLKANDVEKLYKYIKES